MAVASAGFVLAFHFANAAPMQPTWRFAILVVAAALSENYALAVPGYNISLGFPLTMSALLLQGPVAAMCVATASAIRVDDIRRRAGYVVAYNVGQLTVVSASSGWLYLQLGGRLLSSGATWQPLTASDFPNVLLPLIVAAIACALGNVFFAAVGLSAYSGQSPRSVVRSISWSIPSQMALAFVGYLIAQVLAINGWAFPLFVFPLLVARQMYQSYADLKGAYADTVRSLIGALEAKDSYTSGHSERVAALALGIGRELGLDPRVLEKLEYSALLHDLGKLAVPTSILVKPAGLSDEEFTAVRTHPQCGSEMVERIPPLRDLSAYVRHHHERFGGGGYPEGLSGERIELLARILAVADSYDAMTSDRAYRSSRSPEYALRELVRMSGEQFDPVVVRAFISCMRSADPAADMRHDESRDVWDGASSIQTEAG